MRPFRNIGWCHYVKMQAILGTNSGARGRHAFYPTTAALAPLDVPQVEDEGVTEEHSGSPSFVFLTQMDAMPGGIAAPGPAVDEGGGSVVISGATSTAAGASAAQNNTIFPSSTTLFSGHPSSTTADPGSHSSGKRLRTNTFELESTGTSSESYRSTVPTVSSHNTGSLHPSSFSHAPSSTALPVSSPAFKKARVSVHNSGQSVMTSAARAAKITPATAIVGMQGSINRLTDILEKALAVDTGHTGSHVSATPTIVSRAIGILAAGDADLPVKQRLDLLEFFSAPENDSQATVYVELEGSFDMRRAFVAMVLERVAARAGLNIGTSQLNN